MSETQRLEPGNLPGVATLSGATVRISPDGRMDPPSAAAYVGLSEKTLANYRSRGIGPVFIKRGRIFYRRADLDDWLAAGECQSTAQARVKARAEVSDATA